MLSDIEIRVMQLARRQAGYLTRQQALACGLSPDATNRRVRSGQWRRIKPGLYMIIGFEPTLRGRLHAATAALSAVVSHESAAEIHELLGVKRGLAVVTVRIRTTHSFPDVVVHQSTDLTSSQIVEHEGLPVTEIVRTLIDLSSRLSPQQIGRIADRLVIDGRASLDNIGDLVRGLARQGKPGMKTMHRVMGARSGEVLLGESAIEAMTLRLLREWGFPEPTLQMPLPWRSLRKGRVDFAYPQFHLIIEVDGRAWHATLEAFESDRHRDNNAQLAGWRVLRITYRMLVDEPGKVREMIQRAMDLEPWNLKTVSGGFRRSEP